MKVLLHKQKQLTSFQIIIFGFAGVILTGTILLTLPFAAAGGQRTSFADALFTATSSVCVTGLVIQDTATYWSVFGQFIIMLLIQIGGMGVITVAAFFAMLSGRKITLMQRSTMQEAIAAPKMGGIVRLTGFIIKTALLIEFLGAVVMAPVFCQDFGVKRGVWMALFHSVSAFCNAGFDLMGVSSPFSSLTSYVSHPVINLVIMLLIVTGGIGFLTWDDIRTNRLHLSKYRMQSKVILCTTAALILFPALYFFFSEFGGLPLGERVWSSFFQSVTPRTAGFNTVDLTEISEAGQMLMIVLMLIGGSPGSTAGGMKTTTVAVLVAVASSVFSRKEYTHFFGRSISDETVRNAAAIVLMYIVLFLGGGMSISIAEGLPLVPCLFETASAIGTVGLSLGLTPELGTLSRIILIALMFFGRVGGLTLIYAALSGMHKNTAKFPHEKITVG
ncbi:TrkH family potassium uptake protein [Faecalicatena contorta]|uniref:Trk system potassium uptake protein TrkH n=1 Tax=Faecalicatena contorta TaxID=39482 RepID=A0A315ZY23_9FIRM|nr:potassium transporter TrkG [Faecalicatena contorta]PWJ49800.1 trk system potassium uptake protein TrkH [Faecalicatena contorta]SUQ14518.1 trk system potassium uptake protein TrkH [Faecalicatena contorta]